VESVLFGPEGVAGAAAPDRVVLLSSTVDPLYVKDLAPRLAAEGIALLDAPVSGGPAKAAAGTMTMMVSGDEAALVRVRHILDRIAGRVFVLGPRAGDASTFKIVNNLLAAANLAAGAEALVLARAAGLDLEQVRDVVNASSGASWIFTDRIARALQNDLSPRAAVKLLAKDVAIAAALADRLGVDAPFGKLARGAFSAAVAAGRAEDDDAVLMRLAIDGSRRGSRG
jgi:3-hydroxyisobutyrate dehydrogenase-like beta-hydroxyacid dehydrogenase